MAAVGNHQHETNLANCKVAILATNGFEESELMSPLAALQAAGATISVVSIESPPAPFVDGRMGIGPGRA